MRSLLSAVVVVVVIGSVAVPAAAGVHPAATSGSVYEWGAVGDDTGAMHSYGPTPLEIGGIAGTTELVAGNSDTYALVDGTDYGWGYGQQGELANGSSQNLFTTPTAIDIDDAGASITAIGEADDDGFAIDSEGDGWSWGRNAAGEACTGATGKLDQPAEVSFEAPAQVVAGGSNHSIWLLQDGTVWACGDGANGELGDDSTQSSSSPVEVQGLPSPTADPVVAVSAGWQLSGALTRSGALYMWGYGKTGSIGDGVKEDALVATPVPGTYSSLSVGGSVGANSHVLAITASGVPVAWGEGYGPTPKDIPVPAGVTFTQVVAAGTKDLALDTDDEVWEWPNHDGAHEQAVIDTGRSYVSSTANNVADS